MLPTVLIVFTITSIKMINVLDRIINFVPDYQKTWFSVKNQPFSTFLFFFSSFFLVFALSWVESFSSADWLSEHFPGHSSFSRRSSSSALEFLYFQDLQDFLNFSRIEQFIEMLFSTFLTVAKNPFLKLLQNESKLLLGTVHQGKYISFSARN